jgi:hypothetical protein
MCSRLRAALVLLSTASSAVAACSSSPTNCAPKGTLTVQVQDQNVDSPTNYICDATVTAVSTSGGATLTLTAEGPAVDCGYQANVLPGTYTITASGTGYLSQSESEVISQSDCVTASPSVVIALIQSDEP